MHTMAIRWSRLILGLVMVMAMAMLCIQDVQASVQSQSNDLRKESQLVYAVAGGTADTSIAAGENYQNRLAIDWPRLGNWAWARLRELLTLLIFGLLAIWLFPKQLNRSVDRLRTSPGKSTGVGLVVVIVGYISVILLALVVIGLFIFFLFIQFNGLGWVVFNVGLSVWGLILAIFNLFVSYISKLIVAFLIGKFILDSILPKAKKHNIWPLLLGVLLYVLIRSIPWLGWVFGVAATLMGLGAIWLAFRERRFRFVEQSTGEAPPEPVETVSDLATESEASELVDQPLEMAEEAEIVESSAEMVEAASAEAGDVKALLEPEQVPGQDEGLQPPTFAQN